MVDTGFFESAGPVSIKKLLDRIGVTSSDLSVVDCSMLVTNARPLETACSSDISLAAKKSYEQSLSTTRAGAVFVSGSLAGKVPEHSLALVSDDPHLDFVRALNFLFPSRGHRLCSFPLIPGGQDPDLEGDVTVSAGAVIGSGAQVGRGTLIGPNSVIGPGVTIGRNCTIGANVTIECSFLGDDVSVANGARIGAEGFGWLDHGRKNIKIPQLGRTIIQSGVEIGANTTIDRGALGDTVIGENSKIGAMVEVGHGSQIGRNCLLAPMVGLAGGTVLKDGVLMGANAGTAGHLTMGEGSVAHPRASITKDWPAGSRIAGAPAQDIKDLWREYAAVRRLAKGKTK